MADRVEELRKARNVCASSDYHDHDGCTCSEAELVRRELLAPMQPETVIGVGEPDLKELKRFVVAAMEKVAALCNGARWVMSVPARPGEDPDLVIWAGLDAGVQAIAALEAHTQAFAQGAEGWSGDFTNAPRDGSMVVVQFQDGWWDTAWCRATGGHMDGWWSMGDEGVAVRVEPVRWFHVPKPPPIAVPPPAGKPGGEG